MPRTILLGRPWPKPGRPLFLDEDTDGAIALAEEERDTCPSCGMLKVWCRDTEKHQFAFEAAPSTCWPTAAIEAYRNSDAYQKMSDSDRAATQVGARFRRGLDGSGPGLHEPNLLAGLDLEVGAPEGQAEH